MPRKNSLGTAAAATVADISVTTGPDRLEAAGAAVRPGSDAEKRTEDCEPVRTTSGRHADLPRHLLVMRNSAMGDVAMLPHALRALKAAYPRLRITVATQAMFRPFFAGLDVEFLDVDVRGAHRSLRGMWRLAALARESGVDAVADVHDVLRSQAFRLSMRLHGIPVAHIRKGRAEKRRFIRCGGRGMPPLRHTVLRYCDVFRRLGFVFDDPLPVLPGPSRSVTASSEVISAAAIPSETPYVAAPSAAAPFAIPSASAPSAATPSALAPPATSPATIPSAAAQSATPSAPLASVRPGPEAPASASPSPCPGLFGDKKGIWVGFAPFSAHKGKTYPEAESRELVRLLAERYERVFIHSGGGAEAQFAAEMERSYPNVTALWGKVRFAGEIDLVARLDCVVTMDSLVMHLAALVGTPVVSVWGATHPGLGFLGYGLSEAGILQADIACRPCSVFGSKPCRYGDYRCLKAITPQRIAERVAALVAK